MKITLQEAKQSLALSQKQYLEASDDIASYLAHCRLIGASPNMGRMFEMQRAVMYHLLQVEKMQELHFELFFNENKNAEVV